MDLTLILKIINMYKQEEIKYNYIGDFDEYLNKLKERGFELVQILHIKKISNKEEESRILLKYL
jgi:hypothetical protein